MIFIKRPFHQKQSLACSKLKQMTSICYSVYPLLLSSCLFYLQTNWIFVYAISSFSQNYCSVSFLIIHLFIRFCWNQIWDNWNVIIVYCFILWQCYFNEFLIDYSFTFPKTCWWSLITPFKKKKNSPRTLMRCSFCSGYMCIESYISFRQWSSFVTITF